MSDISTEHHRGLLGPRRVVSDSAGAPRRVPVYPTLADTYRARTAKLVAACTIDRGYDQPWLANRSADGRTVYIDRRVPRILKCGIDTDKTLPVHELSEFIAMNDGLRYDTDSPGKGPTAHNDVATPLERQAVEVQKPDDPDIWKTYTSEMDGYIREVDNETITHVAPDQDLRQFAEDDRELLRRIIAAEAHGIHDAVSGQRHGSVDPTGTSALRQKFRRDLDARWLQLRRLILSAFAPQNDILGLCTIPIAPDHAGVDPALHRLPGSDRVVAFRNWLDERLRQIVIAGDGKWVDPYLTMAVRKATQRAAALTGTKNATSPNDRLSHMASLTASELKGICAAVTQQSTRALAHGLLSKQRPAKIAREIVARIDAVGKTRGRMLVNYAVVKAFNGASLDAFRQAGFKKVGTIPEKLRVARGPHGKHLVRDAGPPDEDRDEHGRWTGGTFREGGQEIGSEKLAELTRPGHFYRGMSEAEYKATVGGGSGIISNLSSSIASAEGTNFSADVPTAESYANFGRDDPRKTGKPNYLVEVKGGDDIIKKPDGYYHARSEIPRDRITRVWRMENKAGAIVGHQVTLADEARITPQRRHGRTGQFIPFHKAPTAKEREAIEAGRERILGLERADILTAGDGRVCFICSDASDDGPYNLDDAEGLLPLHVGCRCAWVPVADERFASVHE